MKILFVLEHFYPYIGGAEKLFYLLSTALAKDGHQVVVITTQFEANLKKSEEHRGVQIIRINCKNRFAFTLFSLPVVFKHARQSHIIHTTTYNAALPAIIAGTFVRKPVYITFHEVWGTLWKKLPFTPLFLRYGFYFFEKILLRLPFTKFIAVSDFTKKRLQQEGIPADKIIRIYNGLDYTTFEETTRKSPRVFTATYFGRLGISKGLDLLIPAMASLKKNYPEARLKLIIPKQPQNLFQKLRHLVDSYNLAANIDFKHHLSRADLYQELLQSTCVVIPSYSEGFCFAAAEAVALKVPIISSQQGALKETVSGRFIPMEEMTIEGLCRALVRAYHNKWEETLIRHFPLDQTIERYQSLYNEKEV